ncbi:MAG TPA: endonuclease/exonuclease/phosphatase family protein [Pseudonocardiaceae bacterium]
MRDEAPIEAGDWQEEPRRRRPGGSVAGFLLVLGALLLTGATLVRLIDYDVHPFTAALIAFTPHVAAAGLVLVLLAALLRRWILTSACLALTVMLAAGVVDRVLPDAHPRPGSTELRVLSVNLHQGQADAAAVVRLVIEHRVDLLSLQELTPQAVVELDRAGLADLMPYRQFEARPGGAGGGLAARYPLTPLPGPGATRFAQPAATVDLPGVLDAEVVAVHATPPVTDTAEWRQDLTVLPEPVRTGPVRLLVGDFNATLDHAPLRRLLGLGYHDAAEQVGAGLLPTWPVGHRYLPSLVAVDHVLTDPRVAVRSFHTFPVPGGDHRAVLAVLVTP